MFIGNVNAMSMSMLVDDVDWCSMIVDVDSLIYAPKGKRKCFMHTTKVIVLDSHQLKPLKPLYPIMITFTEYRSYQLEQLEQRAKT